MILIYFTGLGSWSVYTLLQIFAHLKYQDFLVSVADMEQSLPNVRSWSLDFSNLKREALVKAKARLFIDDLVNHEAEAFEKLRKLKPGRLFKIDFMQPKPASAHVWSVNLIWPGPGSYWFCQTLLQSWHPGAPRKYMS